MASDTPRKRGISLFDAGLRRPRQVDRQRLDSDVRALMRQPSTPWITFDRASRASHVGIGDVLPGRVSVVDAASIALASIASTPSAADPSTLNVAADLAPTGETPVVTERGAEASRRSRVGVLPRVMAVAVGCAMVVAGAFALQPTARPQASATASRPAAEADLSPPDLGARLASVPAEAKPAPGLGRLSIRGAAKAKPVFVDGTRLAGTGARSVPVQCGKHVIAVGAKSKGSSYDVPCNGEIVITR